MTAGIKNKGICNMFTINDFTQFEKRPCRAAKHPVLLTVILASAVLVFATGAFAEYTSFKDAMAAGEELLWKQAKPLEAQVIFEQAAALGTLENDKAQAEVRIAVCLIKQNTPEAGIARLKVVLEGVAAGDYVLCDAAVALGDVYSYRYKNVETAIGYYKQAQSFAKVNETRKADIQKKIDRISKTSE